MSLSAMSSEFVPGAAEFVLETCPICLEAIDNTNRKVFVPCSHVFHDSCAQTLRKRVDASRAVPCPMCRTPVDNLPALKYNPNNAKEAVRILSENFPEFEFQYHEKPDSFIIRSGKIFIEWNTTVKNWWIVKEEVWIHGRIEKWPLSNASSMDDLVKSLRKEMPLIKHVMRPARDTRTFRQVLGDAAPA